MNSTTISQPALVWRGKPVQARPGFKLGMTMMETLGGILVGAILTVGAIMLIRMAMDSSKISDAQKSLTAMSIQIRGHFSGVRDYTGLSNPLAIKAGLVPQRILRGDNILTPWGGLSDQVCTAMSTYQPDLWQTIAINGTAVTVETAISGADTLCTGNANTIIYTDR